MADLALLVVLVVLVAAAGIGLGMLAAPRLDAWDQGHAAGEEIAAAEPRLGRACKVDPLAEGGDTGG